MNESIILNITTPDILANATGIQIDLNPLLTVELFLEGILTVLVILVILQLWLIWRFKR